MDYSEFGAPFITSAIDVTKYLRIFYDWYSKIVDVIPLVLFTAGFLHGYGVSQKVWLTVLSLGVLPIFFLPTTKEKRKSDEKASIVNEHYLYLTVVDDHIGWFKE